MTTTNPDPIDNPLKLNRDMVAAFSEFQEERSAGAILDMAVLSEFMQIYLGRAISDDELRTVAMYYIDALPEAPE